MSVITRANGYFFFSRYASGYERSKRHPRLLIKAGKVWAEAVWFLCIISAVGGILVCFAAYGGLGLPKQTIRPAYGRVSAGSAHAYGGYFVFESLP
jgi:hypothetical protein